MVICWGNAVMQGLVGTIVAIIYLMGVDLPIGTGVLGMAVAINGALLGLAIQSLLCYPWVCVGNNLTKQPT